MQKEGEPQFIQAHNGIVQGVAFNPKDRYKFCSGAIDGKINIYNASRGCLVKTARMTSPNASKNINAVKFNSDGTRILTTTTKRLSVIDPEKGALVSAYENCGYSGRERAPLATHPHNPNIAVSGCTNGKGLITFDLRKQQPAHFSLNVHTTVIRDIIYLDDSWPFHQKETICSIGSDGICKIRSLDDKQLRIFGLKNRSNCLAATPDAFSSEIGNGSNRSMLMIGGDDLYGYMPGPDLEMLRCCFRTFEKSINKMKFTSNGHFLFVASGERVERYRRIDRELQFINEVYCHRSDIVDMDISHKDEYLITASRDGTVGLMCLGVPSHGWTGFMQLA